MRRAKWRARCRPTAASRSAAAPPSASARRSRYFALPVLAVPTTYSGSEMTTIWGISEGRAKKTARDPRVLPNGDLRPELTLDLPRHFRGERHERHRALRRGAVRARRQPHCLAHGGGRHSRPCSCLPSCRIEGPGGEDATRFMAPGWRRRTSARPASPCTTSSAMCSAAFGLPHAETHSMVLPHALAITTPPRARRCRASSARLAAVTPPTAFRSGKRTRTADAACRPGDEREDLERAARVAAEAPYPNPRRVEYAPVLALLQAAYAGRRAS